MVTNTHNPTIGDAMRTENQPPRDAAAQGAIHPGPPPDEAQSHVTTRFKHILVENGHAIITGTDGSSLQSCEDEPIRVPGAIQSFGVIIALQEKPPDQLIVRVVSENSSELMGYSPTQMFELHSFCDILQVDQEETLLYHINSIREDIHDPSVDGPEVFSLSVITGCGGICRFWCAVHISQTQTDLIICELELEDDNINPLNISGTQTSPVSASNDSRGTEGPMGSNIDLSQILRTFRNARRGRGEAAALEMFGSLPRIQEQFGLADDLDTLLHASARLIKNLTGFHKVLIYQFDSSWNGRVVTELVDPQMRLSVDLYQDFHFPASDIPAQARELYKINKVRLLYDRDKVTSRLVCRSTEDSRRPLDMTHVYLRAMSPIHLQYLSNMQVRSSMSISIYGSKDLWGLISCHSYGNEGMRVSFPIRKMCCLLGDVVSRNIKRLSSASQLRARRWIESFPTQPNISSSILASSESLLRSFDAQYGALSIHEETKIFGDINDSDSHEILALVGFLRIRRLSSVLASHNIIEDFPDLHYPPGLKAISGFLYMPLSTDGRDSLVFFRKGQLLEIKWGGDPHSTKSKENTRYLEPRTSFAAWREMVLGKSRDWSEPDMETAAVLCFVYGRFIKARRQKDHSMQSYLLLADAAHEVRTPLDSIINNLEIALGCEALDTETRENLTKSHAASKSLVYLVNDLLDRASTGKQHGLSNLQMRELSIDDIGTPCSVFSPGVHAWCINVVYEPPSPLNFDPRGFIFIEWQNFSLQGEKM
ncbi:CheY-like superfamily [Penicillium verhagenii]|uniref:CheY-like superfamily n=1 Tax=Penicillium verhagenii TaxID=1562060 RepID=UPI00254527E9|nr:CheY-like superfamily [Penicillium verhagenii]KAJ5924120.1 CheY-like superfamily [Penicillium verhagenii]